MTAALCALPFGPPFMALSHCVRREPWSKLLILPRGEYEGETHFQIQTLTENGGGGRIRTFEVDDGRFTVCSLWPLGNPTTGSLHCCGVAEEGLFGATLLTLRAVAFGNVLSLVLESNLQSR